MEEKTLVCARNSEHVKALTERLVETKATCAVRTMELEGMLESTAAELERMKIDLVRATKIFQGSVRACGTRQDSSTIFVRVCCSYFGLQKYIFCGRSDRLTGLTQVVLSAIDCLSRIASVLLLYTYILIR